MSVASRGDEYLICVFMLSISAKKFPHSGKPVSLPAISSCWFSIKRDKATDELESIFRHRSSDHIMGTFMVPTEFPIFNTKLINQSKMRIFVGLFKETWNCLNSRLKYGIVITSSVLDGFFFAKNSMKVSTWAFAYLVTLLGLGTFF